MPKGGARPGAGRPRKPIESLVLSGSIRPVRHAARLAVLAGATARNSKEIQWEPTAADLERLQESGREFVTGYLDAYDISAAEGALLLELAQVVDRLAEVRALRVDPLASIKERMALDRLEMGWSRLFASYSAMLKPEVV